MKCYVIPEPRGIDSLTLVERPDPVPGPRQVLVRVRATSLNYRDLLHVLGYADQDRWPLVPCSDGAGDVVAVGAGFAISAEGQALSPGLEGQSTRVRLEAGRIVVGMPVGERRIEVPL